jgi:hypothetical protein
MKERKAQDNVWETRLESLSTSEGGKKYIWVRVANPKMQSLIF